MSFEIDHLENSTSSVAPVNKKQILLDWINTIDEPQCLLVSDFEALNDGIIFIEILKNYLHKENLNLFQSYLNEIKQSEKMSTRQRFNLILSMMKTLTEPGIFNKVSQMLQNVNKDENVMIDFIQFLKDLYERKFVLYKNKPREEENKNLKEEAKEYEKQKQPALVEIPQYLPIQPKQTPVQLSFPSKKKKQQPEIIRLNTTAQPKPVEMEISKLSFDIVADSKDKDCSYESCSLTIREKKSERRKEELNISGISQNNKSFTPDQSQLKMSLSFSLIDYNKIYDKRKKAQLGMVRGIYQIPKHNSHIDLPLMNSGVSFMKFLRPTNPVMDVDYHVMRKYAPHVESMKDQEIITPNHKAKGSSGNSKNIIMFEEKPRNDKITHFTHQKSCENYSIVCSATKNKLYFWLIDIGILKENSIEADDLPKLCTNGVLICDLINRLEGRADIIKGVIRKTTTKSQIQININKIMDHLREIGKFNSRHLWSNNQIASGDSKTIWEFLDDLWHFYSNRNNQIQNDVMKRRNKSFRIAPQAGKASATTPSSIIENSHDSTENYFTEDYATINCNDHFENDKAPGLKNFKSESTKKQRNIGANPCALKGNLSRIVRSPSQKTQLSNNSTHANSYAIANCLGIDTARIEKRNNKKPILSGHYSENVNTVETTSKHNESKVINNISNMQQHNLTRVSRRSQSNSVLSKANTVKEKHEKSCFIIFQKSHVNKLKKEIDRYSKSNTFASDNSLILNEIEGKGESGPSMIQFNQDPLSPRIHDIDRCNEIHMDDGNKNEKYAPFTLGQGESNKKDKMTTKSHMMESKTAEEKDNEVIKTWLVGLGLTCCNCVDFSKNEISQFKDGIYLSNILSVLEKTKIAGINPNPRSKMAASKNIQRSLEILRTKKNMPYDYLWSEDEILRGNGHVIRALLKQIKKAYERWD